MLRSVVGDGMGNEALEALLLGCDGDISAASNTFFDGNSMSHKPMTPHTNSPPTGGDFLEHLALAEAREDAQLKASAPLAVGVPVSTAPDSTRPSRPQSSPEVVPMGLPVAMHCYHEGTHPMAALSMNEQMVAEIAELRARVSRAEARAAAATEVPRRKWLHRPRQPRSRMLLPSSAQSVRR